MDQAVKAMWVEALRSGRYQQGHGTLKSPEGFCCLGVLCDLALQNGVDGHWEPFDDADNIHALSCGDKELEIDVLPRRVQSWAGLDSIDPILEGDTRDPNIRTAALSWFNDARGLSFPEIADMVEAQL